MWGVGGGGGCWLRSQRDTRQTRTAGLMSAVCKPLVPGGMTRGAGGSGGRSDARKYVWTGGGGGGD
jgi:hypothetical protein